MGTIVTTVTHGTKPTVTKTYTLPDADIDRMEAAWQQAANISVNGTATRPQVFLTWANQIISDVNARVVANEAKMSTPPPITVS